MESYNLPQIYPEEETVMKPLPVLVLFVTLGLSTPSCKTLPILKGGSPQDPVPPTEIIKTHELVAIKETYLLWALAAAAFFFLWALIKSILPAKLRKCVKLSDDDIEMLGLAADTLSDLWHRLRNRSKSKTIPFPRGNE